MWKSNNDYIKIEFSLGEQPEEITTGSIISDITLTSLISLNETGIEDDIKGIVAWILSSDGSEEFVNPSISFKLYFNDLWGLFNVTKVGAFNYITKLDSNNDLKTFTFIYKCI